MDKHRPSSPGYAVDIEEQFKLLLEPGTGVPLTMELDESQAGELPPREIYSLRRLSTMMPTSFNIDDVMEDALPAGQITDASTSGGQLAEQGSISTVR
jgi:hypothetical protein